MRLTRIDAALLVLGIGFIALHTWAFITRAYIWLSWIDIPIHIMFGAFLMLVLIRAARFSRSGLLVLGAYMLAVGVGWEGIEFLYDTAYAAPHGFTLAQHGIVDDVTDIMNNFIGAGSALVAVRYLAVPQASRVDMQDGQNGTLRV